MHDNFENVKVFDAHSDLPTLIWERRGAGFRKEPESLILEREKERFFQNVASRVMSVWTPLDKRGWPTVYAFEAFNRLIRDVDESSSFDIVTTVKEMDESLKAGRIALWLGMEGGEPLGESLDLLDVFYRLGLRVLTLTWSLRNALGDGAFERTGGGLSSFGVEVVGRCEELGVLVDVSHLNERGFWDTLDVTSFPVIASHSNARALRDHVRNLNDDQIKAIAERDGVIGAIAVPSFMGDAPSIDDYVAHVTYMVDLVGYRHVGFGFDFTYYLKGLAGNGIRGFENEADIPVLLRKLGENLSEKELRAIAIENFRRVFERVVG